MSIITAIYDAQEKAVWVGSNGRATIGSFVGPSLDKKWIALGGWLIGITGTGPKAEALAARADAFPQDAEHPFELLKFMRQAYSDFEIGEMEEGLKRYCGSGLIVHKSGAIWDFDNSFCLTEVERGAFWARGSGMDVAIGAALALRRFKALPKETTIGALEIVISHDVDCPGELILQKFDERGVLSEPVDGTMVAKG